MRRNLSACLPAGALPIFGAVAMVLAANGLLTAAVPGRLAASGASTALISALGASAFGGAVAGAPLAARAVRRVGSRAAFAAIIALFGLAIGAFALPLPLWALCFVRVLAGCALPGLFLVIETGINAVAVPERRGRLLATYMTVFYGAQAAGAAGSTLGGVDERGALLAAGIVALTGTAAARAFPRSVAARPTAGTGRLAAVAAAPAGFVAAFGTGMALGTFYGVAPLFARAVLSRPELTGAFMALAMTGGLIGLRLAGRVADRFGAVATCSAWNAATAALALGVIAAGGSGDPAALAARALYGVAGRFGSRRTRLSS